MAEQEILRAALAQINTTVGDLPGNRELAETAYLQAMAAGAALVVFPELALTGYPPEDLLLKPAFLEDTRATLERFAPVVTRGLVIIGLADMGDGQSRNGAALIADGRILDIYHKCTLPNYGVFDERRYFSPGVRCPVYTCGPWRLAVNICEDLWVTAGVPTVQATTGRANLMINLSASPYHADKGVLRAKLISSQARRFHLPVLYTNLVGGQDELVFDGQSLAVAAGGSLLARAPQFEPHLLLVDLPLPDAGAAPAASGPPAEEQRVPGGQIPLPAAPLVLDEVALALDPAHLRTVITELPAASAASVPETLLTSCCQVHEALEDVEEVYQALILGLRDYVRKNGFGGVVIGLSGGIDSALTAVIAADALGADAVVGISMPTDYTSAGARAGAAALARNLGIAFHEIPIRELFAKTLADLAPILGNRPADVTEENIQARLRGMILMAQSNKHGQLVLATGNKSEMAVGYCTLYGDMVGGFSVLKDVFKTHVYRLAHWRNSQTPERPPIPEDTLTRPPSAELRPDQRDTDSLPDYETLDPIVKALVETESSARDLIAQGFPAETVARIFRMIQGNEYKRRQGAPGIKITPRAFGRDRRYPLTNRYRLRET